MRLFIYSVGIFLISFFSSCINKNAANLWFYTHSSDNGAIDDTLLTPASFLNLQPDGSYTRDFGFFEYGKWTTKNEELLLTNASNDLIKIPIQTTSVKELQLLTGKDIVANFESQPISWKAGENNPFSLANNKWRIPATHKETEDEIKKRLINHCQFWVSYFTWANEYELSVVDVRSTPTLIKIYGNGFGLKPYEELPAVWRSYFFDREDCKIANNLIYEVLQYHDISWAHTDSKYKMFIGAFQQLKQYLL